MELLVEMHNSVRWWKCTLMCDVCLATNPTFVVADRDFDYTDFGDGGDSLKHTHLMCRVLHWYICFETMHVASNIITLLVQAPLQKAI